MPDLKDFQNAQNGFMAPVKILYRPSVIQYKQLHKYLIMKFYNMNNNIYHMESFELRHLTVVYRIK